MRFLTALGAAWILSGMLFCCARSKAATLPACEVQSPTINDVKVKKITVAGVAFEAQVNPGGGETTYEFVIDSRATNPSGPRGPLPGGPISQNGRILAGDSQVTVSAFLSGLQPGYVYSYDVRASNLGGEVTAGTNSFSYFDPSGPFDGWTEGLYIPPHRTACANESGDLAAARTVQEQQEKERAEKEAAAAQSKEEAGEEEAEKEQAIKSSPRCVVPALRDDTLSYARRALAKAHCRLGKVNSPTHHHATLIVVDQSHRHGENLESGTTVAVTLGMARSKHRRTR